MASQEMKARVKEVGAIFRDTPMHSLDKAVYYSEYVIRHKGAKHLQSPGKKLYWFQRDLWDVTAFLALVSLLALYLVWKIISCPFKLCCSKRSKLEKKKRE